MNTGLLNIFVEMVDREYRRTATFSEFLERREHGANIFLCVFLGLAEITSERIDNYDADVGVPDQQLFDSGDITVQRKASLHTLHLACNYGLLGEMGTI